MTLRDQIQADMKAAMKARDSARLSAIRMLWSAVKQKEVDERITADDKTILSIIAKATKEHRDSLEQYEKGGREDLVAKEKFEIELLGSYLPKQMTDEEIAAVIDEAVASVGATGMAAMGRVMAIVKPKVVGRADMGRVSAAVRSKLAG